MKKEPKFFKPTVHPKGWGEEVWIDNREEYCGKLLKFKAGASFSNHYHLLKRETFYLLKGKLSFQYFDLTNADVITKEINEGECIFIDSGIPHKVDALEDSVVVEVSTQHFEEDSYRVGKGDSQKK